MRYKDLIDVSFTAEDVTEINTALTTLETKLATLRAMSKEELKRTAHIGQGNEGFTVGAINAGLQKPNLLPPNIDMVMVQRDQAAREILDPIAVRLQTLTETVQHSRKLMGADLYAAARAIYKALQEFGRDAGIGALLEELGRRFKGQGRQGGATPPPEDGGTTPV